MAGLPTARTLPAAAPTAAWATGSGRTRRSVSQLLIPPQPQLQPPSLCCSCAKEDVASFIASLNVFPHAAENVYKLCKPYEGDPRCQKEQLCFDLSIHFCGCTDSKPLTISMSLFKCLCTNLTSNKSVTIKISFHFTQAMLQLLYQS